VAESIAKIPATICSVVSFWRQRNNTEQLKKKQKYDITLEILKKMNSLQPRGRFLRFSLKTFTWCEISQKDAREKVSQSIRDALKKLTQVDPRLPRAPQKPHMSSTVLKKCIVTKYPKHCRTYPDPPRKDDQSLSTNILATSSELSHRNSRLRILYKSNSSDKFKSAELVKDTSNAICFDGLQSINLPKIPKRIKKNPSEDYTNDSEYSLPGNLYQSINTASKDYTSDSEYSLPGNLDQSIRIASKDYTSDSEYSLPSDLDEALDIVDDSTSLSSYSN